jgi:hypothetical protein
VFERCRVEEPRLNPLHADQAAACHLNDRPAAENPLLSGGAAAGRGENAAEVAPAL